MRGNYLDSDVLSGFSPGHGLGKTQSSWNSSCRWFFSVIILTRNQVFHTCQKTHWTFVYTPRPSDLLLEKRKLDAVRDTSVLCEKFPNWQVPDSQGPVEGNVCGDGSAVVAHEKNSQDVRSSRQRDSNFVLHNWDHIWLSEVANSSVK